MGPLMDIYKGIQYQLNKIFFIFNHINTNDIMIKSFFDVSYVHFSLLSLKCAFF